MRLAVYRGGDVAFTLDGKDPLRMVVSANHKISVMNDDTINVVVESSIPLHFSYRDYLLYENRPYMLNVLPEVKKSGRGVFRHNVNFEGGMFELGRILFTMADLNGWDYFGSLHDMCMLVVNEMNRACITVQAGENTFIYTGRMYGGYYVFCVDGVANSFAYSEHLVPSIGETLLQGDMLPGPVVSHVGGAWTLDFEKENGTVIETEVKQMTYDSHSCLSVLQDMCSTWEGWEFHVVVNESDIVVSSSTVKCGGKIILRRKQTGFSGTDGISAYSHLLSYGKSGGLTEIIRKPSDDRNVPTRIYFYGGRSNVPTSYRCTRICLPFCEKEKSYLPEDDSLNEGNGLCEVVKIFDSIYPANKTFKIAGDGELSSVETKFIIKVRKSEFFDLFARWKDPSDTTSQSGTYSEWRKIYGTDDLEDDMRRYLLYYYKGDLNEMQPNFPKSCYLTNKDCVSLTFQTGELAGYEFKVLDFDTNNNEYYYMLLLRHGVENVYGNVINFIPNESIICDDGDEFIIQGCLMPPIYTYYQGEGDEFSAEGQLLSAALEYMNTNFNNITFDATVCKDYVIGKMLEDNAFGFRVFDTVTIEDEDVAVGYSVTNMRIEEVERNLVDGISYKIKLGMSVRRSGTSFKKIIRLLTRKTENARQIISSSPVLRGTANGQKIMLNGVDVTDSQLINIIDATNQWFGTQSAYDELVANNLIVAGVVYNILQQSDWNETDENSLGYIKNKPLLLDMEPDGHTAKFFYK